MTTLKADLAIIRRGLRSLIWMNRVVLALSVVILLKLFSMA